ESEALAAQGEATVVMDLEGTLFFANAEDLAGAIRERRGARFVILDLRGVTDIDATGARILEQTRRSLAAAG
ncbi:sodium-independent anion transporter, partial [Enterobacter cloacae]